MTHRSQNRRSAGAAGLAALLVLSFLGPSAAALAALAAPEGSGPVLVLTAPWADLPAILADAGGRPIGPALGPSAALAVSSEPDFPARLAASGAWFALDGALIAQICGAAK